MTLYKPHPCRAIHSEHPSLLNQLKMAAPRLIFLAILVSLCSGPTSSSRVNLPAAEKNTSQSYFDHAEKNNITITNITNSQSSQVACEQPCVPSCIDPSPCCQCYQPCYPGDDSYGCSLGCPVYVVSPSDEQRCNERCPSPPPPPPCSCGVPMGTGSDMPIDCGHVVRSLNDSLALAPRKQLANATVP